MSTTPTAAMRGKRLKKIEPHGNKFHYVINELRSSIAAGDTPQEIAWRAGVSVQTIYNWLEYNVISPHFRTVVCVAKAIGLDLKFVRVTSSIKRKAA